MSEKNETKIPINMAVAMASLTFLVGVSAGGLSVKLGDERNSLEGINNRLTNSKKLTGEKVDKLIDEGREIIRINDEQERRFRNHFGNTFDRNPNKKVTDKAPTPSM